MLQPPAGSLRSSRRRSWRSGYVVPLAALGNLKVSGLVNALVFGGSPILLFSCGTLVKEKLSNDVSTNLSFLGPPPHRQMPAGAEKAESRGEKAESPEPKRRQMPAGGEKAECRGEKAESPEPKRRRVEESAVGHEREAAQERGPVKAPSPGRTFMASTHFCYYTSQNGRTSYCL